MILLNSNAQQVFWLGRYLNRIQYLCSQFPFRENDQARDYAHAFCLPAFDADSLNALVQDADQPASFSWQFQYAQDNIQDLRGLLSAVAYAELNKSIKRAQKDKTYICDTVDECQGILEAESQEVFLFFKLGQNIEQFDRKLRLKYAIEQTLHELGQVAELLGDSGWDELNEAYARLKKSPDSQNFYHFNDSLQHMFEVGTCSS